MSIQSAVKSGFWIYAASIVNSVLGLLYWIIMSSLLGAEVVGYAAAVLNLALVVSYVANLGVNVGVNRYVGEAMGRRDTDLASSYFWSAFTYLAVIYAVAALATWLLAPMIGLTQYLAVAAAIVAATGLISIAEAYAAAVYRGVWKIQSVILSHVVRFFVSVMLLDLGLIAVVVGNVAWHVANSVFFVWRVHKHSRYAKPDISHFIKFVKAGFALWFPGVIVYVAQQTGFFAVFTNIGAQAGGQLYIAQALVSVLGMLAGAVGITLTPYLSSMSQQRREVVSETSRLVLALVSPAAVILAVASNIPLSIIGADFMGASLLLSVLALTAIPDVYVSVVISYLMAEKKFLKVLVVSVTATVSMMFLYAVLIPALGALGAALARLIAGVITVCVTLIEVRPGRLQIYAVALPLLAGSTALFTPQPVAVLATLMTYALYPRLNVLTRRDVAIVLESFLGERARHIYQRFKQIVDVLFPR